MKFLATLILYIAILVSGLPAYAVDGDGRYIIIAPIKSKIMLIDSATGRTWSMTTDNKWKQIEFYHEGKAPRSQIAPKKMSPAQATGRREGGFTSKPLPPAKSTPLKPLKQKRSK